MSCVLPIAGLFVCSAALALSTPSGPGVERDCVAASLHARPAACAVSDLDGDRQADYALSLDVSGLSARPASISIHLSRARESYQLLLPEGLAASSFILRDVNGDGKLDIALLGGSRQTVGVFLNDGLGNFQFDRQERYLTAPSSDCSEIAPPQRDWSCDCAEPGFGSYCAVAAHTGAVSKPSTASLRLAAISSSPAGIPRGVARSRAP